jgi:hypothetical protein
MPREERENLSITPHTVASGAREVGSGTCRFIGAQKINKYKLTVATGRSQNRRKERRVEKNRRHNFFLLSVGLGS